ncbi:hypothetical protein ACFYXC_29355 [Streptomyces sp. NPDC002701]|uniref:hypothetical protein n=1 Tax=Streptomyces sp. NPDC002701 TaxID=3364661 RepID=UPI00367441A3
MSLVFTPVVALTSAAFSFFFASGDGPPTDAAAPRAVLLDHSDALNERHVDYEAIVGLSSLALVSKGPDGVEALALADNSPGLLFPLTLGSPFDLNPTADTAHTLRRANGQKFPQWYDGEGLVLDLAACPAGGPGAVVRPVSNHGNPLVDNVEGMAVGKKWTTGRYQGWQPLYLICDDNNSVDQITRLYSPAIRPKP